MPVKPPTKQNTTRKPASGNAPKQNTTRKPANSAAPNANTKRAAAPKQSEPKSQEKEKKSGGFIKKFFLLFIFLLVIAVGYVSYQVFQQTKTTGNDFTTQVQSLFNDTDEQQRMLDVVKNDATNISNKTKEYSKIALEKASEYSDIALEKSKEYKDVISNFSKETFKEVEEKVKKFGAKSSEELSAMADNYLDMEGSEKEEREYAVESYKGKDMNELVANEKKKKADEIAYKETIAKNQQEAIAKKAASDAAKAEESKPVVTQKVGKDITNLPPPENKGFVTPEKKPNTGLQVKNTSSGAKNEDNIEKLAEAKTALLKPDTRKPASESLPADYVEGRKVFLEALKYYKKSMPGMPNDNDNRKKAYYLFKKSTNYFANVSSKMEGNPEYDQMSVDAYRFMHGCGKSMLVNDH